MDSVIALAQFGQERLSIKSGWFRGFIMEADGIEVVVSPYDESVEIESGQTMSDLVRLNASVYVIINRGDVKWEGEMSLRQPFAPKLVVGLGSTGSSSLHVAAARSLASSSPSVRLVRDEA